MRNDPARENVFGILRLPYVLAGRWYEEYLLDAGLIQPKSAPEVPEPDLIERLGLRIIPCPSANSQ